MVALAQSSFAIIKHCNDVTSSNSPKAKVSAGFQEDAYAVTVAVLRGVWGLSDIFDVYTPRSYSTHTSANLARWPSEWGTAHRALWCQINHGFAPDALACVKATLPWQTGPASRWKFASWIAGQALQMWNRSWPGPELGLQMSPRMPKVLAANPWSAQKLVGLLGERHYGSCNQVC